MKKVLTIGTWDPVHVDHVVLLRRCEKFGSVMVGVNSDRFVEQYRGKPAVFTQQERSEMIEALGYRAAINDGPGRALIASLRPNILVVGSDWLGRDYLEQIGVTPQFLQVRRIALMYLPRGQTISGTEMKARIRA